jgi:ABC-type multidrug transport system ATPase subunit
MFGALLLSPTLTRLCNKGVEMVAKPELLLFLDEPSRSVDPDRRETRSFI